LRDCFIYERNMTNSNANKLKVNINGATKSCTHLTICVDILTGSYGEYIDSFSDFLGVRIFYLS